MRRLAYSSVVRLTWQHSAAPLPRIFKRSQIDSVSFRRPALVAERLRQNARFCIADRRRLTALRGRPRQNHAVLMGISVSLGALCPIAEARLEYAIVQCRPSR